MLNSGSLERVVELGARIVELRKQIETLEGEIRVAEEDLAKLMGGRGRRGGVAATSPAAETPSKGGRGRASSSKQGEKRAGRHGVTTAPKVERATPGSKARRPKKVPGRARRSGAAAAKKAPGKGTIMEGIVGLLESRAGQALSVADVAGELGAKPASIATMLKRLLGKGRVTRPETGRYAAA